MNEELIKKEAKALMDVFMAALDSVPEIGKEFGVEREKSTRTPEKSEFSDFKEQLLKNAPRKKDSFILTEKKTW